MAEQQQRAAGNTILDAPKICLQKALLHGKEATNTAAQEQARAWAFMREKGHIFCFVVYSAQPKLYKSQERGLFLEQFKPLSVFQEQESFAIHLAASRSTKSTPY